MYQKRLADSGFEPLTFGPTVHHYQLSYSGTNEFSAKMFYTNVLKTYVAKKFQI